MAPVSDRELLERCYHGSLLLEALDRQCGGRAQEQRGHTAAKSLQHHHECTKTKMLLLEGLSLLFFSRPHVSPSILSDLPGQAVRGPGSAWEERTKVGW